MHILLLTGPYPPEIRAISFMMQELAEGLLARGHQVTVAASWPQYNLHQKLRTDSFKEYSTKKGVRILRVKTLPQHKAPYFMRGLAQLSAPALFLKKIRQYVNEKIDVVSAYSPPFSFAETGAVLKRHFKAAYFLNIQDIFPQNAIDLGILHNPLLIRYLQWREACIYRYADMITTHTRRGRDFLMRYKAVAGAKIATVTNWLDEDEFNREPSGGGFRERLELTGKFIFLFGGVMGPSQGLTFIVEIAKRVSHIPQIVFLLAGEGTERSRIEWLTKRYHLNNIRFMPFLERERYRLLMKEADAGLACLSSKNSTPVIPGKIINFMASSLPVIAFLHKESEGHALIEEAQCGYSAVSDDYDKGAELIIRMFKEKMLLGKYGENGFAYAREHFSRKNCIDRMEALMCAQENRDTCGMR